MTPSDQALFDVLARIADTFGWEFTERDPGIDTEVDTFSDVWRDDTHFADCGCLWSNDLDLLEPCDEHAERRGAPWQPSGDLESWAKLAGIMDPKDHFGD